MKLTTCLAALALSLVIATTGLSYDYGQLLTPQGTQQKLDGLFRNYRPFFGRRLLDHDAVFTKYRMSSPTGVMYFYAVRIVYAEEHGYGFETGPFEVWFVTYPVGEHKAAAFVFDRNDFYGMLNYYSGK